MENTRTEFNEFFDNAPRRRRAAERPDRLGTALREARLHGHLELEDLAEITHIRVSHLEALEAGRWDELPGDHGRTFVRRYAQAVGLEPSRALLLYSQARRGAEAREEISAGGLELPPPRRAAFSAALDNPRLGRVFRPLAVLLLVGGAVWLGLELFNRVLLPGPDAEAATQSPADPETAPATETMTDPMTAVPANAMVLLSLRTVPPGAEVSIDGYRFGQTPLVDAPVRAGERTLTVERGGYRTFRRTFDLSENRNLSVTLLPTSVAGHVSATRTAPAWRAAVAGVAGDVTVTVSAPAWLEVYRGNSREGERLVYETAGPGDRYTFRGPVYIFSGNAGGVSVAKGEDPARPLGASGAVVGAAY